MVDRIERVWRFIAYLPLLAALPLGGEATRRDVRRKLQPRLDLPLPDSYSYPEILNVLAHKAWRSIFYYRLREAGTGPRLVSVVLKRIYPGDIGLTFSCPEMGPGLLMMHGLTSMIGATRIGIDCQFAQMVVSGYNDKGGPPAYGDRVRVSAGAILLGPIEIGDDAVIGAGAVVVRDVPAGAVVGGVPARVLAGAENRFSAPAEPSEPSES